MARMAGLGLICFLVAGASGVELPSGTKIEVRLTKGVSTADARPGDTVEAVVIRAVFAQDQIALAPGTQVLGKLKETVKPSQTDDKPAALLIQFDSFREPGSTRTAAFASKVAAVDNARESVDAEGRIVGIAASKTPAAKLDEGIGKVAERYPGFGDLLGKARSALLNSVDPNITYPAGVEMTLDLTAPLRVVTPPGPIRIDPVEPAKDLPALVEAQPQRTQQAKTNRPSDFINIIFIGDRQTLEDAFTAAGWFPAETLNKASSLETIRAVIEDRGYKDGPVSTLLLDGEPPNLVYQKQNNTFAKRHHLRIWLRPGKFNDKEIWVCAATHDTSINFSAQDRTFTHKIDPDIDLERAKVVSDLLFTGMVRGLSVVDRPEVSAEAKSGPGAHYETDGKIAIIEF